MPGIKDLLGFGTAPSQMDIIYNVTLSANGNRVAPRSSSFERISIRELGNYPGVAPKGDGCLCNVPEIQHSLVDIERLSKENEWKVSGVVELPAEGDILIHDMMILHGSQPKRSPLIRRMIYFELRAFDGIRKSGKQSEHWADLLEEWMQLVLEEAEEGTWPEE